MATNNMMDLSTYYITLVEQLERITKVYIDFGVDYHEHAPYLPPGPVHGSLPYFDLRPIYTAQPENTFLARLSLLHIGVPHYAAAGVEPDNPQGGKMRWLEKLDEELADLRLTLVAAESHLQVMRNIVCDEVDQEMLASVTADRIGWETAIAAFGSGRRVGAVQSGQEVQFDEGDPMEE
jgi:hypothetical protein